MPPQPGWHVGPYVTAGIGMITASHDKNLLTGESFDKWFARAYSLKFGTNILDNIGAEAHIRFSMNHATFNNTPKTQWILVGNLSGKYTFCTTNLLLKSNTRMLPYIKTGLMMYGQAVPGSGALESKTFSYGAGMGLGLGLDIIFPGGFMIDVEVEPAFIYFLSKYSGAAKIIDGGINPQINTTISVGYHF